MAKKQEEIINEEVSSKKAEYIKILEAYKKQNPAKYEIKKAAFEKKLASL